MKKNKTRVHSFNSKGDRVYLFAMRAPKSPEEVIQENAAPGFLIAMPEENTLEDLHKYICKLLDRKVKNAYFRFGHPEESREELSDADKKEALEQVKYYVSEELLEENPEYHSSNTQLRILHLKESTDFAYRLKVTASEWQKITLIHIAPIEPDEEYPTSVRVVARVKMADDNKSEDQKVKVPFKQDVVNGISEVEEEKYVLQMHKEINTFFPLSFSSMMFMFSCIGVMEYLRLHKLINFADEQERKNWEATIIYSAGVINAEDPLWVDNKIELAKIVNYFKVDEKIILDYHSKTMKCLDEENVDFTFLTMTSISNNDLVKEQLKAFKGSFENKKTKIHKFNRKRK